MQPSLRALVIVLAEDSVSGAAPTAKLVALLQDIANVKQEHFVCFSLGSNMEIIERRVVFIGTLTTVIAHPREIFSGPITDRAYAIVVAHNHPSGDPTPSPQDIELTQQLVTAGQILGICVHDHIIVADNKHFSFRRKGLIGVDMALMEKNDNDTMTTS